MNLQQLYYFKTISELENYTKASEQLKVAQSSLSHSISDMESELGFPLFYKVGRNIKTTEYGLVFLNYVKQSLAALEEGLEAGKKMVNPYYGTVRIEFVDTMAPTFIPKIINAFSLNEYHKEIQIKMKQQPTNLILESFKERKVDLGFGSYVENTNMEFYPVLNEEMYVIVSLKSPLAAKDAVDLREISHEKIITYNQHSGTRVYIDSYLKKHNLNMEIIREVETDTLLAGFVSTNVGIGIMPKMFALDLYNVKALRIINSSFKRPLYMFWQKDEFMLPVVRKFRDFVIEMVEHEKNMNDL